MYLLARHFGIGAHEALYVRPTWEIDSLLSYLARDLKQKEA